MDKSKTAPIPVSDTEFCGAKTKGSGKPCKNPGLANGRCRFHGGATPRGVASANYKHGKYSKYLKGSSLQRYLDALSSEAPLSLLDDIAIVDMQIVEVFSTDEDESTLPELWLRMDNLRKQGEAGTISKGVAMKKIMNIIRLGAVKAVKYEQITKLQAHKKTLIEAQNKTNSIAEKVVSVEEMMFLINRFIAILREFIRDRRVLTKILDAIEKTVLGNISGRA